MAKFIDEIDELNLKRALDVAGGDGRFSKGLLIQRFDKVDLFDQCPLAIKRARVALQYHLDRCQIGQATMQSFKWKNMYSGIFLIWCLGYLSRREAVAFLRKAKERLIQPTHRISRLHPPQNFIFVLDNALGDK